MWLSVYAFYGTETVILANTNMAKLGDIRIEIATRLFEEAKKIEL